VCVCHLYHIGSRDSVLRKRESVCMCGCTDVGYSILVATAKEVCTVKEVCVCVATVKEVCVCVCMSNCDCVCVCVCVCTVC
jgi:hypothetical protein